MTVTIKHNKVSTVPDTADTSLVRPSDWNADHTVVGLGTAAELNAGQPNGVATLDSTGKVPTSQIPLQGDLNYQGVWNATTNTPTLASGTGTKGYYYVVDVAGTTNLDGITDWNVGDWAIFNGTVWQKVDNTDSVTSVNGKVGAVVLTYTDVGAANAPTNTNITSMTGVTGGISSPDFVQFDTTVAVTEAVAKLQWDDGNGTLQFGLKGGNVNLQVGQELVALCYNDSGTNLVDGQIVYISGAHGNRVAVKLARADSETTSAGTLGMVTEPIAAGAQGFITLMGTVNKLNTNGLTAGHLLYLSATTAGAYTETPPAAPNHKVTIGYVERVSSTVGSIYVKVDNGYELDELHNVEITSPTGGNLLVYDQTGGYWKNANLTDGTGISITEGTSGTVTITNSAPDQTVSLSAGTGISTSGTYPNFTITNTAPDQTVALTAGTGISTSGTYPNFTITNTAPDQVVSISGGGTTTVTGTYPNFTVSSADQYTGTVTSVAATAGTGISVSGSPITTSGTLTITNTAPDQVVAISAGTGISVSGTYPNFTVTNTSPSSGGTVTSVDVSGGTTGLTTSGGPVTGSGTITLAGTLGVANGGTGLTSLTANRIPYGNGTSALGNEADFTYDPSLNTVTAPQVSASNGIIVNSATVSANYTIPSGSNAMSAGPVTVASGITVTVTDGAWVIV